MSARYEPGTELYAARDCVAWRWGKIGPQDTVTHVRFHAGEDAGTLVRYWASGDYLTTERYGARHDWDVNDVTAGAVQEELGL